MSRRPATWNPPGHGLTTRLRRFYDDNPGEELSMQDIMDKFGCTKVCARNAITKLRQEGVGIEGVLLYRLKQTETA
jgi:biotin operon repressor